MNTYVKLPEEVNAIQFTGENGEEVLAFLNDNESRLEPNFQISVKTIHGFEFIDSGWWVIKDRLGFVTVLSPKRFEVSYRQQEVPA